MLTVRELISDLDVRLLAGEEGVDLPVRWVHMSELLDPTPWLSGGEILLTTGMQLGSEERQREFIERLSSRRLAGLGFGTGFGFDAVPPALIEAAAERDFPLFEVPYELPFIAITEKAFTQLVNEQYAILRRALAAQERLERIVLSERGLQELSGTLATLVGGAVLVFDARGELLVQHAFRRPVEPAVLATLQAEIRDRAGRRSMHQFMPATEDPSRGLALPVATDGASTGAPGTVPPQAWLVALKDSDPLSDFDRLALRHAVTIIALELLRARVAGDTERRLAGDVLSAIVSDELRGGELARRLEPFGCSARVAAIVTAHPEPGRGSPVVLESALAAALRAEATGALVASTSGLACALIAGPAQEDELFALAERLAERVSDELGRPITLGVGRAVDGGEARRAYHEARCTLEAVALGIGNGAPHINGNGSTGSAGLRAGTAAARVATYRDLGSFQLLLSLQDDEALKLFCDSILGPIEASEGHYGGELMRSLEAFIEENGQWERAARRLYCHRHTLRYRIRRVEELTGRDLGSARDRIEFWLALRARELVV